MPLRPRPFANVRTGMLRRPRQQAMLQRAGMAAPAVPGVPPPIPGAPVADPLGTMTTSGIPANAMAGIDWILNPNIDFTETDTAAAEQAVGGGFGGSQFAGINTLRLRDSERMKRVALGNELLQPYLERSAANARQLISEAGLDRRLNTELANRLQIALINGDQQSQQDLLREAGMDRRQSAELANRLQTTQMGAQSDLLRSLLSFQAQGSGGSSGGREPVAPRGTNYISSTPQSWASGVAYGISGGPSGQNLFGAPMAYNPAARPGSSPTGGGSSTNRYTSYIDSILRSYGLPG